MLILILTGETAGSGTTGGFDYTWIIMIVMIVLLGGWMFFSWRSNKKKQQEQTNMLNSIELGDEITTIGGIEGRVVRIKDDHITIESGRDRTKICFARSAIATVVKKQDQEQA